MSLDFIVKKLCPIAQAFGAVAIPVAIWMLTNSNREVIEQQQKSIRASTAVQNYLKEISSLQEKGLNRKEDGNLPFRRQELRDIGRAYTIALLRNPDLQRDNYFEPDFKGQAIEYLSDLALIHSSRVMEHEGEYICLEEAPTISLERANLSSANLEFIFMCYANLGNANLEDAILTGANLIGANLRGAKGLTEKQFENAKLCRTELPENLEVEGNRDCDDLNINPQTGEVISLVE